MKLEQLRHDPTHGWISVLGCPEDSRAAQLVLVFGERRRLESGTPLDPLRERFPDAHLVVCSSGGEILGEDVLSGGLVATALRFEHTQIVAVKRPLRSAGDSFSTGEALARDLPAEGLRHVLVFSEGLQVNGTALAQGFEAVLPETVAITGGLAADGERFERTVVGLDSPLASGQVVAVGLYGERLQIGMGSLGGWEAIGPERTITRSDGNVLLAIDDQPALSVYRSMIGAHSYGLPVTGLLYPLFVQAAEGPSGVVRTLLNIDEAAGSLTFASDMPEGRRFRLMHANLDRIIDAAGSAASQLLAPGQSPAPSFALLISCIGRKLVLQQRTREELQSVRAAFGPATVLTGFYSYGELSPMTPSARCDLHNQTMTITTLTES